MRVKFGIRLILVITSDVLFNNAIGIKVGLIGWKPFFHPHERCLILAPCKVGPQWPPSTWKGTSSYIRTLRVSDTNSMELVLLSYHLQVFFLIYHLVSLASLILIHLLRWQETRAEVKIIWRRGSCAHVLSCRNQGPTHTWHGCVILLKAFVVFRKLNFF